MSFPDAVSPAAALPRRDPSRWSFGSMNVLVGLTIILVGFLVCYPITWLVYGSFSTGAPLQGGDFTLTNFVRAYSHPEVLASFGNTLVFAAGQTIVSVGCGTFLAWIVTRTNTPGKHAFEFMLVVVFLLPLILGVLAWTMLLSPGKGIINHILMDLFGLKQAPFDIYSMGGMIFVQGLYVTPLAFMMITPAFRSMDGSLEESARMSGAGNMRIVRDITLPLMTPAILSSAILIFIIGVESFDVPQMLGAPVGIFTYTSRIYHSVAAQYPADYGVGTALAVSLFSLAVGCVFLYRYVVSQGARYVTVRGKGQRAGLIDLGCWRFATAAIAWLFFLMAIILPTAILTFGSLLRFFGRFTLATFQRVSFANYGRILEFPRIAEAFGNTMLLSLVSAAICVLLSVFVAYIAIKTKVRGRGLLEALAMTPISFPATVLALGLLWGYVVIPLPIYGTLAILVIAFVTRYLPISLRTVSGGVIQLSGELEEAARMSGASWIRAFLTIVLPLLRPVIGAAFLILFMIFVRELGMSILLTGVGNPVLSVVMYDFYETGELGLMSALSIVLLLIVVAISALMRFVFGIRIFGGHQ
jgi:iron(III) transport system permease protein